MQTEQHQTDEETQPEGLSLDFTARELSQSHPGKRRSKRHN
jgi:hypothetical protein